MTLVADLVAAPGMRTVVAGTSKDPNAKLTVLLFRDGERRPALVAKLPTTDRAAAAVERERRLLVALHEQDLGPLAGTVPRVLRTVDWRGRPALLMTAVPGSPLATSYHGWRHYASQASVAADFWAAAGWLRAFEERTTTAFGPGPRESLAARLRWRFRAEPDIEDLALGLGALEDALAGDERAAVHGDFWFGNLLVADGAVSGVVDWEHAEEAAAPTRDWARFALSYALYLDRHTAAGRRVWGHPGLRAGGWGAGVVYAIDGEGWFPALVRDFLGEGLRLAGLRSRLWRHLALVGLAEVAAGADHDVFAAHHLELFRRLSGGMR
jgi:phosphotransferase family enzyme